MSATNGVYTSRDRVLCALNHEEPDRVPFFFGTSGVTTVLGPGYPKLCSHLGVKCDSIQWFSKPLQYTRMDEEILERLGSDARPVTLGPAISTLAKEVFEDYIIDAWGVPWRRAPGSIYYEIASFPLRSATIDDLDKYPWPNLTDPSRFVGVAEKAKAIQERGYATVLMSGLNTFEAACLLRGMDVLLMDMAGDEDLFKAIMAKFTKLATDAAVAMLEHLYPYIDVIVTGDDLGMTAGPMMSPASYRRLLKPYHAEFLGAIHAKSRAKVFFHSCGNIYSLLGDLAEAGVDIINPVQVNCGEMGDTARLKREFGDRLTFCGGIDTQQVMPHGTPDEVRAEVRRRLRDLAPGGGYLAASVHCLQPDVPPENIVAMCEEIRAAGKYPIG
jgi:uroporphyrinogen decarboxylase